MKKRLISFKHKHTSSCFCSRTPILMIPIFFGCFQRMGQLVACYSCSDITRVWGTICTGEYYGRQHQILLRCGSSVRLNCGKGCESSWKSTSGRQVRHFEDKFQRDVWLVPVEVCLLAPVPPGPRWLETLRTDGPYAGIARWASAMFPGLIDSLGWCWDSVLHPKKTGSRPLRNRSRGISFSALLFPGWHWNCGLFWWTGARLLCCCLPHVIVSRRWASHLICEHQSMCWFITTPTTLQPPYYGLHRVLEPGDKALIDMGGEVEHISVDSLKPAHLDCPKVVVQPLWCDHPPSRGPEDPLPCC